MALLINQDRARTPRLLLALGIYFFGVVLIAAVIYVIIRQEYMSGIDARLVAAAENLPKILPADFHDRAIAADSINRTEDQINLDELSRHAVTGGFAYLYTYVIRNGTVYFTASSYTADDVKNNNVSHYWTDYPESKPVFLAAMQADGPLFETYSDRWGTFRSALIHVESPKGNDYVVGADMDISIIERALWWRVVAVFAIGIIMLGLALPFVRAFPRTYDAMNDELLQLNEQLDQDIEHTGKAADDLRRLE